MVRSGQKLRVLTRLVVTRWWMLFQLGCEGAEVVTHPPSLWAVSRGGKGGQNANHTGVPKILPLQHCKVPLTAR